MKRNDLILAGVLVAIALLSGILLFLLRKPGNIVVITVDGQEFGEYPLDEDRVIDINGTNVIRIKDGEAKMIQADCPDKLCMDQKAISSSQESIICLPNRVVAVIEGERDPDGIDAVAG